MGHLHKRPLPREEGRFKSDQKSASVRSAAQSCLTLCGPMVCSLPGSSVHGILQARILEWVAIFFSRWSSWPRDQTLVSCVSCTGWQVLYSPSLLIVHIYVLKPSSSDGKESACNVWNLGLIPGLGSSPGGRHGYPFQFSCLENLMDREAWWATVHRVAKSRAPLKWLAHMLQSL